MREAHFSTHHTQSGERRRREQTIVIEIRHTLNVTQLLGGVYPGHSERLSLTQPVVVMKAHHWVLAEALIVLALATR